MIYLDNAATTRHKPDCVVEAVTRALCSLGNPGRGAHEGTLDADRMVFETRLALAELFHAEGPDRIAFTANSTEALNIVIKGILQPGDHVISTVLEHNSVLRPLYEMEDRGVELTLLPADRQGRLRMEDFEAALRPNTRAIVCTHGSNLTGNLVDIARVGSVPRGVGSMMLVTPDKVLGTIGGGESEYRSICHARETASWDIQTYGLHHSAAGGLDMACGGRLKVLFLPV